MSVEPQIPILYKSGAAYFTETSKSLSLRWLALYPCGTVTHTSKALDALSQIYEFGIGVEPDKGKALFWKKKYCDVTGTAPGDVGITRDQLVSPEPQETE